MKRLLDCLLPCDTDSSLTVFRVLGQGGWQG